MQAENGSPGLHQELGVLGAAGWTRPQAALQAATASLKQLAQEKGLLFGSCLALKYCAQFCGLSAAVSGAVRHRHTRNCT